MREKLEVDAADGTSLLVAAKALPQKESDFPN